MSAEPGPRGVFDQGCYELRGINAASQFATEEATALRDRLAVVEGRAEELSSRARRQQEQLMGRIHAAAQKPGIDPGEYLWAALSVYEPEFGTADAILDQLAPLRAQMRREVGMPIALLGSSLYKVLFGRTTAGDIQVVPAVIGPDSDFSDDEGVRLAFSLDDMSGIAATGETMDCRPWRHFGRSGAHDPARVRQILSRLRVAGTIDELAAWESDNADLVSDEPLEVNAAQNVRIISGLPPMIAYGRAAVSGVLSSLYNKANPDKVRTPLRTDVMAAAISLGLSPSDVKPGLDVERVKRDLRDHFFYDLTEIIRSATTRPGPQYTPVDWTIATAPRVSDYAEISHDAIREAVTAGLRGQPEQQLANRFSEQEARDIADGLILDRYGVVLG